MQKTQVFLRQDQKDALRIISTRSGEKQSALIRRGVDLLLEQEAHREPDWKEAWRSASGIWRNHEDYDTLDQAFRQDFNRRMED